MNTILGIKQAQMQRFLEDGTRIPVTVIRVPQNVVVSVKTQEKDGYQAVQLGMGSRKRATKALLGHAKKASLTTAPKVLHEVKTTDTLPQGEFVAIASVLQPGDIIKVTGMSKGKGFAGGVKRHGFKGGPRTHGQSDRERAPGSLGQTTTPGRVYKGKRMAGRMGHEITSVMNLVVVDVNEGTQEILVKGLVPGNMGSVITLTKTAALPAKKIMALLADPFAPVVEEVAHESEEPNAGEVSTSNMAEAKVDEVSNVSEGEPEENVAETKETEGTEETKGEIANESQESEAAQVEDSAEQNTEVVEEVKEEVNG